MGQEQVKVQEITMGSDRSSLNVEQLLEEFSSGVNKCAGWVRKTSISSIDEKARVEW